MLVVVEEVVGLFSCVDGRMLEFSRNSEFFVLCVFYVEGWVFYFGYILGGVKIE